MVRCIKPPFSYLYFEAICDMRYMNYSLDIVSILTASFINYINRIFHLVPPANAWKEVAMFSRAVTYTFAVFITCSACAPQKNDWADVDYSGVYKAAAERQIDNNYKAPTVVGCVDDDLYNCK